MYYVYRIESINYKNKFYTGYTSDLKKRVFAHNNGQNKSTAPYKPWKLIHYSTFESKQKAMNFERYLKSGSGKAFAHKRLW